MKGERWITMVIQQETTVRSQFSQLFARNRAILLNKTAGRWGKKSDREQEERRVRQITDFGTNRGSQLLPSHKWGEGYAKLCKFPWLLSPVELESNNAQHTQ